MYKLIQLPKYNNIIVSNEAVKIDEWCIEVHNEKSDAIPKFTIGNNTWYIREMNMNTSKNDPECKKLIAGYDNLPSIDYSMLSEKDCKKINYLNFEKLYRQNIIKTKRVFHDEEFYEVHKQGFIEGLKFKKEISQPKIFNVEGYIESDKFKITKLCN